MAPGQGQGHVPTQHQRMETITVMVAQQRQKPVMLETVQARNLMEFGRFMILTYKPDLNIHSFAVEV